MRALERYDPEVAAAIRREEERQWMTLELIASENYTSPAVLEAMGSRVIHWRSVCPLPSRL